MSDDLPDPEAIYARYLETCGQIGVALVTIARVRDLVNGRNELSGRMQ